MMYNRIPAANGSTKRKKRLPQIDHRSAQVKHPKSKKRTYDCSIIQMVPPILEAQNMAHPLSVIVAEVFQRIFIFDNLSVILN